MTAVGLDGTGSGRVTVDEALSAVGVGRFQMKLFGIFGLVWAADAMQVLSVGFTAPSIATTYGISVPDALWTGFVFFLGMMVGAALLGLVADRFGRRSILVAAVLLDLVAGLASAFAPDFTWLLAARFFAGLAVGGILPVDYAMMAEFLPAQRRGRWLVLLEGWWAVGTLLLTLIYWWAPHSGLSADPWRVIFFATAIPALIGVFLRLWVPESPYYLLKSGQEDSARAVLQRVATTNGGSLPAGTLSATNLPKAPLRDLFAGPLMRRTVLIMVAWLLVSSAYYGVFVWLPKTLAGNGSAFIRDPLFLVLVALAQLPGYALAAWGVEKIGRRPTLVGFLVLSALGCFLYTLSDAAPLVASATLLMSFALLGTWGALYAWTPELFPTALRGTGMGFAGAMARLGGLLAPSAFAGIVAQGFGIALTLFAVLLAVAAVCAGFIRQETRAVPLD